MSELLFRGQTRRFGERVKNFAGDPMPSNRVYGGVFHQNNRGGSFSIIYSYDPTVNEIVVPTLRRINANMRKNQMKVTFFALSLKKQISKRKLLEESKKPENSKLLR